jgi:hypothetical protein
MGIQIIKRKSGVMPQKEQVGSGMPQISYNSDGHIAIRYIESQDEDTLIVLDQRASETLKFFIQMMLKGPDNGQLPF